jgi:hypothetical protein
MADAALDPYGEAKGEVLRVLWPLPGVGSDSSSRPDMRRRLRGRRDEEVGVEVVLEEWEVVVGFMAFSALAVRENRGRHRRGEVGRQ